jgi:hypothetical protein
VGEGAVSLAARIADRVLGPRVPDAELPHPVPPGVVIRRNRLIPAIGGVFMGGGTKRAGAVTLGRTILFDADRPIAPDLIVHELVHVRQWNDDPLFPLKYCGQWLRHGYRQNPYEVEAYARQKEFAALQRKSAPARKA